MGNDVQLVDKWYRKDSNKVSNHKVLGSNFIFPIMKLGRCIYCKISVLISKQIP